MKVYVLTGLALLVLALVCTTAFGALQEGVKVQADGEAIDVNVGHLVPVVLDWNGDGKKDLIVGQFSGGKIRLYLNGGTDSEPVFKKFTYLQAGNKEIRLPAG